MRAVRFIPSALLLCGAVIPGALAAQDTPPAPPRTRVKVFRDSTMMRDSNFVRITLDADRIEAMIHELMASKQLEAMIGQSLREAAGQPGDSKKTRELSESLAALAKKNATLITTLEMTCAGDHQPEGYIGVQFSQLQTVMGDEMPMAAPMREYPKIDSVYANSPASKAGARRGDMVLLIGGVDSRRPVQLDKLLKPGTKLALRVQRDGSTKDLTITIEKRPTDFNSECANVDQFIAPEFDQPIYMRAPRAPMSAPSIVLRRSPAPPDAPSTPMAPMSPPPMSGYMYGFSTTNSAIAGATLQALDDGWRATLGVDNGILVTKVLPGTPSNDAGLRSGDVITSADGQAVASVRALSRIVANAKSNAVKLQIIRSGKQQVVMLRWQETSPP
ncbi:MAG TPA: PDZ domain-containing protein [Gemmatimonadaceae bacterium]|nr:PDZ domain-containing protein [Gemmatimonadaceae bacterium]